MLLGLVVYIWGQKFLVHVGNTPTEEEKKNDVSIGTLYVKLIEITDAIGYNCLSTIDVICICRICF